MTLFLNKNNDCVTELQKNLNDFRRRHEIEIVNADNLGLLEIH